MEETFEVYLDVKEETFDEKYSDDENEKRLDKLDTFKSSPLMV